MELFILVTLNASYKSIHLNQHLPLAAAALQSGSRGADSRRGWGVRAVVRGDVIKGRHEGKGWERAGEVGEKAQTQLCGSPASTSLILNGHPLHLCGSQPGGRLNDDRGQPMASGGHTAMLRGSSCRYSSN